jgi:four helix bundle protein
MKSEMEEQTKKYDLEERTERFSLRVRDFCMRLKKDAINLEYIRQLIRAAGSVPSNYIEANESLGNQDRKMHIKICRKESKESRLWLKHILTYDDERLEKARLDLIQETIEIRKYFWFDISKVRNSVEDLILEYSSLGFYYRVRIPFSDFRFQYSNL